MGTPSASMRDLSQLPEGARAFGAAIRHADHLDLFLDYDGVLTSIAAHPDLAVMDDATRDLLKILRDHPRFHVSIVSGRALRDVRAKVNVPALTYAGNHGMEIAGPDAERTQALPVATAQALRNFLARLLEDLRDVEGVVVEDKVLSLAVHVRLLEPAQATAVRRHVEEAAQEEPFRRLLACLEGKALVEIRPAIPWDKGEAVLWLLRQRHGEDWQSAALPLYLGDDTTDEDAFRALGDRGITVHVGADPDCATLARFRLRDPQDVKEFLVWLTALPT